MITIKYIYENEIFESLAISNMNRFLVSDKSSVNSVIHKIVN